MNPAIDALVKNGWREHHLGRFTHGQHGTLFYHEPRLCWMWLRPDGAVKHFGSSLADAVYAIHPEDAVDAGLGALLLRGLSFEMGAEYTPVVEAVR